MHQSLPQSTLRIVPARPLPPAGSRITTGESATPFAPRCLAWVSLDIVSLVERNQLQPEQRVKLCNPESCVYKEAAHPSDFVPEDSQLTPAEASLGSQTSAFVKAIPNIAVLMQVWLVDIAIRICFTQNIELTRTG